MSAYRRVPIGRRFDAQRTDSNALNRDLHKAEQDIDRLKRRKRCLCVAVIVLAALLAATLIGYGVWIGVANDNQNANVAAVQSNVTIVQQNLMQLIIEMNGNITVLQRGNFSWALANGAVGVYPAACVTPAEYLNQGQEALLSTYELQNVQIGSMNFTVLVLQPPPEALTYTYVSDFTDILHVCMLGFTPNIDILDTFNVHGPRVWQFTASNTARLDITPNCIADLTCLIQPHLVEAIPLNGAYSIDKTENAITANGQYFLQYFIAYPSGSVPLGMNVTLHEALQLVLLSS